MLSFRQRDELAAMVERAGWNPIAARRAKNAERRFVACGSSIAVVDARGAFEDGLAAVRDLADPAEANAAALMVLVSRNDTERIADMLAAGATHFLASPFGEHELAQALHFAERHADRLGRSFRHEGASKAATGPQLSWRVEGDQISASPALVELLGLESGAAPISKGTFFSILGDAGEAEARSALARILKDGKPTAFAHALKNDGEQRLVHNLSRDGERVVAHVEQPDRAVESKSLAERDYLTGLGDARKARQWIDLRLAEEAGKGARLALLLVALHRFDMINASYGQGAGDAVLQGMARRIEKLVGPTPGKSG